MLLKNLKKNNKSKEDKNIKIIEIYEYGNGVYAKPFWTRVQEKINKVEEQYNIINMDKNFIPAHSIGKNCMGAETWRADELFLTLYCEEKGEDMGQICETCKKKENSCYCSPNSTCSEYEEAVTLEKLRDMADEYLGFSCKPKTQKYKAGTVLDEDKSVKWNREEVERLNKKHEDEVKELNRKKSTLYNKLVAGTKEYIMEETKVSKDRADKIYAFLLDQHLPIYETLNFLDGLLELFK